MTARAKADDDAPSSAAPPSYEAPLSYDADVRIPAPPILPTAASMGMESLGAPSLTAREIARGPASEVRALRPASRGSGANVWVGVGVGVVLSLAVLLVYLLRQ